MNVDTAIVTLWQQTGCCRFTVCIRMLGDFEQVEGGLVILITLLASVHGDKWDTTNGKLLFCTNISIT